MVEDRWTEQVRRAVSSARNKARQTGDSQVCTEHLLLGVLGQDDPQVRRLLEHFDIPPERLRQDIEAQIVRADAPPADEDLPLAPRVQRVMDLAQDAASSSEGAAVRPAHVLLALISEGEGLAARVLSHLGARQSEEARRLADQPAG